MKSEIIKILSDKQNTWPTNTTDAVVLKKQIIDQDTVPTKTTDSWTNTDISNKTDHTSLDRNSLIIPQLHRTKENQSKEICDKTKELRNLDHNHKHRNTVSKKVVIIDDLILNGIDEHGSSNQSFKVRIKNHPGATAEDIYNHLKSEIRKKPDVVIIHVGTNDLANNSISLSLESCKHMADSIRSKLPNSKPGISNVIARKDKNEIDKGVETFKTFQNLKKEQ